MSQEWIISHFSSITGWEVVSAYTEDWPRVAAFASYRGNNVIESFQVYLDRTIADDIAFCIYRGHRETRQLDVISLYSEWLTCGSSLMYLYLHERVIHQFGYLQIILSPLSEFSPSTFHRRDLAAILEDFKSHLVP